MSGTGRDAGGSAGMGDQGLGSAEVHTGLHSGGSGDKYEGLQFAGHDDDASRGRLGGAADAVRERARSLAGDVGPRVTRAASGTRERAHRALEQRGVIDRLRDNPLPILGVAFAIGFVLAGRDDDDDYEPSMASRARRELRNALMGGVSAGLAQGARGFLSQTNNQGSGFLAELLDSVLGGGQQGGSQGGGQETGGSRGGSRGTSGSGSSGGGSTMGSGSGGGSSSGSTRGGMSGSSTGGGTGGSRPPSHQENY